MTQPGAATNTAGDTRRSSAAGTATAVAAPAPKRRPTGSPWWVRHYTFTGTTGGLIFVWFSMTPSLLPRSALFQGLVSGISGAIGYGIGVFTVWLVRYMRDRDSSAPAPRWAWKVLIAIGTIGMVIMAIRFHVWQDDVRDLMGVAHLKWYDYPLTAVLSLVVLFTLVELGQLVRLLVSFLVELLDRFAPFRLSATIVVAFLIVLAITLINGVVVKSAMSTMNHTFASVNNEMNPNTAPPKTPLRS
ncbi:MAG: alpha/beta-hydrolase N-terminal domain-containing protein, partial [Mycobacterium sp.]|nr:alpha/beta-hydrolase N-terminal domain-containing protein [Mycobacterium sp.]